MNINQRINILYEYINNNFSKNNFQIIPIDINKLIPSDVELDIENSKDYLNELMKYTFQYLFTINNDIYFKIYNNNQSALLKISSKKNSLNDNAISYILSYLVLIDNPSNILLPIVNFKSNCKDLKEMLLKNNQLEFYEKNKNKVIDFKIRECFYNLMTLRMYMNDNTINYKYVLFYIIYSLIKIKETYKYFSHNNLNLDNIFVYINDKYDNEKTKIINYNNLLFYIPEEPIDIKITNFENSQILNSSQNLFDVNNDFELRKDEDIDNDLKSNNKILDSHNDTIILNDQIEDLDEEIEDFKDDSDNIKVDEINYNNDLITLAKDILKENKNIDLSTKNFLTKLRYMKNNNIETLLNDNYFDSFNNSLKKEKIPQYKGLRKINNIVDSQLLSDHESILGQQKLIRNYVKDLKGGAEKTTTLPYQKEKNNPFITNDERNTFNKKQVDAPPPKVQPKILEQTIYDTSQKQSTKQEMPPAYIPIYDVAGNIQGLPYSNMLNPVYNQPIQKVYNVSLANPLHNFSTVSRIYEDIIPGDPRSFSFNTTFERYELIQFIRNLINDKGDGENMNVTGGKNTLLSSIKLLDLNPYSLNKNPYTDLGVNFLIFRGAYPIRYDQEKHKVNISKSAHGLNVRIYNLTIGEKQGNNINEMIDNYNFNVWRDLKYYKFILDEIIHKKVSPNFISSILYKIDDLSNIEWDKLQMIQHKKVLDNKLVTFKSNKVNGVNLNPAELEILFFTQPNNSLYTDVFNYFKPYDNIKLKLLNPNDPTAIPQIAYHNITSYPTILFNYNDVFTKYTDGLTLNKLILYINNNLVTLNSILPINTSSGESLVLVTEAPHSNFIKWASPVYENYGSLKRMVSTGYHSKEVWQSILFQLLYIIIVLQENKIYFGEFSLENNIYIKDLYYDSNNLTYWIYKINGLEYYVPNYGYLVLFDSKYSDLNPIDYKIKSSKLFPNKNDYSDSNRDDITFSFNYNTEIFNQFKKTFDPDNFNNKLKNQGGLEPTNHIIALITNIKDDPNLDLKYYIRAYFSDYLHNRIGTYLNVSEKETLNILNRPKFQKGELVIKIDRYDEYKVVLLETPDNNGINHKIINRDDNNIREETVNSYTLIGINSYQASLININDKNIIERYILN